MKLTIDRKHLGRHAVAVLAFGTVLVGCAPAPDAASPGSTTTLPSAPSSTTAPTTAAPTTAAPTTAAPTTTTVRPTTTTTSTPPVDLGNDPVVVLEAAAQPPAVVAPSISAGRIARTPGGDGYWVVQSNGAVKGFGSARSLGSPSIGSTVAVAVAPTSTGAGYWVVASDGGVFTFGDAQFYGSMGGKPLNKPIVSMAPTKSGRGYWLTAADGGVFAFGDAPFLGGMGGKPLNQPIVGIASTPTGNGYWLAASDGGIFAFGDAQFYGSLGGQTLNKPVVAIAPTPSGRGYWMAASDGGLFAFGDAQFYGSMGGKALNQPVIGMAPTPSGRGYWLVAGDGGIFSFGDANYYGNDLTVVTNSQRNRIVDIARSQLGVHESGPNVIPGDPYGSNRYGPWCSSFVSWVWRSAGVSMPYYPFSGNVYTWARSNTAVRPIGSTPKIGDALLVGSGPGSTATSTHITLVVGVSGNRIQTIGGNEGNAVRLTDWFVPSSSKYYGYASPLGD